jgi:hypothetical protein
MGMHNTRDQLLDFSVTLADSKDLEFSHSVAVHSECPNEV